MNNLLRWSAFFVALVGNAACVAAREADAPQRQRGVVTRADSGIELRVFLPRDTIDVRDSLPVEVQYLIVNGPTVTKMGNAPESYLHRIEREDGRTVLPVRGGAPPTVAWGRRVLLLLPAHAWLGQTRDMRCLSLWGGYGEPIERDCLAEYDFREPGTFHVIVEHMTPDTWPNMDSLTAVNDTSSSPISVEPLVEGRLLADTATLIVLPE